MCFSSCLYTLVRVCFSSCATVYECKGKALPLFFDRCRAEKPRTAYLSCADDCPFGDDRTVLNETSIYFGVAIEILKVTDFFLLFFLKRARY